MRVPGLMLGMMALGVTCLAVFSADAVAKGGPYVDRATLAGASLPRPSTVSFSLPEGYDDMYEAPPSPARAAGTMASWYDITLHYDFNDAGHGRRTRQGKYDGADYLYLPEAMVVGPGTWASGWFRANPLLAEELRRALAPSPPAAGSGVPSSSSSSGLVVLFGLLLLSAGFCLAARPARV